MPINKEINFELRILLSDTQCTLQHRIVGGGRPVQREVGEGAVVDQHRHLLGGVARRRPVAPGQPHAEGDVERPVACGVNNSSCEVA